MPSKKPEATKQERLWLHALAEFLRTQSHVEAVSVDMDAKTLKVATLGEIDEGSLKKSLKQTLSAIETNLPVSPEGWAVPAPIHVERTDAGTVLQRPSCVTAPHFWTWREVPWPLTPAIEEPALEEEEEDWRVLMAQAVACAFFGLSAFVVERAGVGPLWLPTVLYGLSMLAGGWDAAMDVAKEIKEAVFDIHFLMLAVAIGAASIGAWAEGALLLFLFSFSGALEHYAFHRTRNEIESLIDAAPKEAVKIDESGRETLVPVETLVPGDMLRVKPGELFPVDAVVVKGSTAADEANLTGEATPVEKAEADELFGGTMNLWGAVEVRVLRPSRESALQKIIRLIQEAQHLKAPSQRFTDKFGTRYTLSILGLTMTMFFVWWLGFGMPAFVPAGGTQSAFYRAMTLLVVASPCALVLSIPSAILAAIAWGARHGVLFRGGAAIENLAEVNVVALDKTGTLTTGELVVESVESFPPGRERETAELAYAVERRASHPIARAIVQYGEREGLDDSAAGIEHLQTLPGRGLKASSREGSVVLGRRELLGEGPLAEFLDDVPAPPFQFTEVWVIAGDFLGRILLKDKVRPQSKPVLESLSKLGLHTVMLTGDRRETAEAIARELGLDEVRAGLHPEDKVDAIQELKQGGRRVVMVGDGMNDAPSLAAADVAVAMGARGSDSALEQSDIVLMQDRIENFLVALRVSQSAKAVIRQNLVIALGTVILMAVAAMAGLVPLSLGVFAHEGSTVLVCLNSLRLLFIK